LRPLGRSRIPNAGQERTSDASATVAIRYVQVPELPIVPEPQGRGGRCDERHASGLAVAMCEESTKTTAGKLRSQPVPDFNQVSRLSVVSAVALEQGDHVGHQRRRSVDFRDLQSGAHLRKATSQRR